MTLADVKPETVRWLWPGYVPLGKLTVVEGDPGLGKSTFTLTVAASVSAGRAFPDSAHPTASDLLIATYEDGVADTIVPRVIAAGGNVQRIHVLAGVSYDSGPEGPLTLPEDVDALDQEICATGAQLVVVDPLGAALSAQTDSYKDADVRRALAPLSKMAEKTGAAIIVVRHLNKNGGRNALTAGAGSVGITAAARMVLAIHAHPNDVETRRIIAVAKCNLTLRAPSLVFRMENAGNCARIVWEGTAPFSADELMAARVGDDTDASATDEASDWLRSALATGPSEKKDLLDQAKKLGISQRTLERAKQRIRAKH